MKKLMICIAIVGIFAVSAYAQTGSVTPEGQQNPVTGCGCPKMQQMQSHGATKGTQQMPMEQSMGEGQQMPMMCPKMQQMQGQGMMQGGQQMPMMQHMMGQNMMARDMMYMMTDIMKMQKKIISGVSPSEKKEALKELDKMMDRMDKMMSDMRCSCKMMGGMTEPAKEVREKEESMQKEVPKTDPHGH